MNKWGIFSMRYTTQHLLLLVLACGALFGVNVFAVGQLMAVQCVFITCVVIIGGSLGLWWHSRKQESKAAPPAKPLLVGVGAAICVVGVLGYLLGSTRIEICARTQYVRKIHSLGLIGWTEVIRTPQAALIEEKLKYRTKNNKWVPVTEYWLGGIGDWMPWHYYPQIDEVALDLETLAYLEPVEASHQILEATNRLDVQFAQIRNHVFLELRYRLGDLGGKRRPGTDAQIVRTWWKDFEPLLRPLKQTSDLRKALMNYARLQPSSHLDAFTRCYFKQELAPFVLKAGLGANRTNW